MNKNRLIAILGLLAALIMAPVIANEPVDCFYEANKHLPVCK